MIIERNFMIGFCPLASGSKGNCIYFGTEKIKILIDAGISFSYLEKQLEKLNVTVNEINAILITHEHLDHISGLKVLSKYNIPVLVNSETAKGIYHNLHVIPNFKIFTTHESFELEDLKIFPFSVQHDTLDPVGFTISTNALKVGFCADTGYITSLIKQQLDKCDYLYLEANHQVELVHASNRPAIYKKRVLGKQGHLSNEQCANLLCSIDHSKLKHVYLAHLSSECNNEKIALREVEKALKEKEQKLDLSIAYQDRISKPVIF